MFCVFYQQIKPFLEFGSYELFSVVVVPCMKHTILNTQFFIIPPLMKFKKIAKG